jgi:hypothetical protein
MCHAIEAIPHIVSGKIMSFIQVYVYRCEGLSPAAESVAKKGNGSAGKYQRPGLQLRYCSAVNILKEIQKFSSVLLSTFRNVVIVLLKALVLSLDSIFPGVQAVLQAFRRAGGCPPRIPALFHQGSLRSD